MITKFFIFVAFCFTFLSQMHDFCSADNEVDIGKLLDFGIAADAKFDHPIAQATIDQIFKNLRTILTNARSAEIIRELFTNTRIVLTGENGRQQILTITNLISFLLRDKNTADIINILCDEILIVARDELSGGRVISSLLNLVNSLSSQPNLILSAEGLVAGFNYFLKDVTPKKMEKGVARLRTVLNLYGSVNTKKVGNTDITIRDLSSSNSFNSHFNNPLFPRSISQDNFNSPAIGH